MFNVEKENIKNFKFVLSSHYFCDEFKPRSYCYPTSATAMICLDPFSYYNSEFNTKYTLLFLSTKIYLFFSLLCCECMGKTLCLNELLCGVCCLLTQS